MCLLLPDSILELIMDIDDYYSTIDKSMLQKLPVCYPTCL